MTDDRRPNAPEGDETPTQGEPRSKPKGRMPTPGEVRAAFRKPRQVNVRKPGSEKANDDR